MVGLIIAFPGLVISGARQGQEDRPRQGADRDAAGEYRHRRSTRARRLGAPKRADSRTEQRRGRPDEGRSSEQLQRVEQKKTAPEIAEKAPQAGRGLVLVRRARPATHELLRLHEVVEARASVNAEPQVLRRAGTPSSRRRPSSSSAFLALSSLYSASRLLERRVHHVLREADQLGAAADEPLQRRRILARRTAPACRTWRARRTPRRSPCTRPTARPTPWC